MDMKKKNICGQKVKEARLKKKLTQIDLVAALAEEYGIEIDRTALARIEVSERSILDYELIALANLLDVSVQWLFGNEKRLLK